MSKFDIPKHLTQELTKLGMGVGSNQPGAVIPDLDNILDGTLDYKTATRNVQAAKDGFVLDTGQFVHDGVTSSGGKGRTENVSRSDNLAGSLYGTNRFNKLWNLYNDVKGQKGIESNPKYQRLLRKLMRKMPKTLKNLERNVEKTERKRQAMNTKLGFEPTVSSTAEIVSKGYDTAEKFAKDHTPEYVEKNENVKNKNQNVSANQEIVGNTNKGRLNLAGQPWVANLHSPINLGDGDGRLGIDINKALKNKKW